MKKTLAAVLAAAMALSTATVAMATDFESEFDEVSGSVSNGRELEGIMGKSKSYVITSVTDVENDNEINGYEIGQAMAEGQLKGSVIVASGRDNLDGTPGLKSGDWKTKDHATGKYYWRNADAASEAGTNWNLNPKSDLFVAKEWPAEFAKTVREDAEITVVLLKIDTATNAPEENAQGQYKLWTGNGPYKAYKKGGAGWSTIMSKLTAVELLDGTTSGWATAGNEKVSAGEYPELSFTFKHTYGTSEKSADIRMRFTVRKDITLGGVAYKKGDTITTETITVKASYHPLSNYYTDMQLTVDERNARNVILEGDELYNEIGNTKFTVTVEDDIVMFAGKAASNQKDVNLWYEINETGVSENDELVGSYDADITIVDFKGKPTFQNSGDLYFAADSKNTTVYEWVEAEDAWVPISTPKDYDSTYKTVKVSKVKKLGKYAISSEAIEVEEEPEEPAEPAEPVDSTPSAEPDDDEGKNPNTGAC